MDFIGIRIIANSQEHINALRVTVVHCTLQAHAIQTQTITFFVAVIRTTCSVQRIRLQHRMEVPEM